MKLDLTPAEWHVIILMKKLPTGQGGKPDICCGTGRTNIRGRRRFVMKTPELTTLCYLERDGQYLMLHRVKKEHDINKDKYIGVGGHFLYGESPDECLKREVLEETGLTLTSYRPRGIVTFVYGDDVVEYMHLFTADAWEGELKECDEGTLEWIDIDRVCDLPIWEGDKAFFRLLKEGAPFFSLKLVYTKDDRLTGVWLNGEAMTV